MQGFSSRSINWFAFHFAFIGSVLGLLDLFIIAPWQCRQMVAWSGGKYACELNTGWYFYVVVLVLFAVFSGYQVYRMRRDGE